MKTWDKCRNESDLSVMVKFSKNVTTYTVQKRISPAPATQPRAYLRDDLRVIRHVTCLGSDDASSDDSSSLDSSRIAPKCWRAWAVDNSCGMSSPSSVRHSGQGTPQLKQTGMSLNQGIVKGSLTEKAQFSLGYAGSFLRHWSWQHSIILFVGLSPGFHPSVAVFISASSILAFKWSNGLASNSLHTKFATTSCIFHVNFNLSILRLSTLNPSIKMNCQTAISYRGLRNDNKFEEGMMRERANSRSVTIDYVLPQASGFWIQCAGNYSPHCPFAKCLIVGHSQPQCLWVLLFMRRRALGQDWSSGHLQNVVFIVHVYCVNANSRFKGKTCTPPIFRSPWSGNLFLRLSVRSTSSP